MKINTENMKSICSCCGGVGAYLLFIGILIGRSSASSWSYTHQDEWGSTCLIGQKQSPINLEYSSAVPEDYVPFKFTDYDIEYKATSTNNGHTVQITLEKGKSTPTVSGGGLPDVYVLEQIHFHWGSEHTINGERLPLEMHLVHYAEKYGNFDNAKLYESGVAVLGVLFHNSPDDDVYFQPFIQIIPLIQKYSSAGNAISSNTTFSASVFLPRDRAGYYRYEGSLTTPTCDEGVIWTIFTQTLPISQSQTLQFQKIWTEHNGPLTLNYRDIQDLNDRKVYLRKSPINSGATLLNIPVIGYVALIALAIIQNSA